MPIRTFFFLNCTESAGDVSQTYNPLIRSFLVWYLYSSDMMEGKGKIPPTGRTQFNGEKNEK